MATITTSDIFLSQLSHGIVRHAAQHYGATVKIANPKKPEDGIWTKIQVIGWGSRPNKHFQMVVVDPYNGVPMAQLRYEQDGLLQDVFVQAAAHVVVRMMELEKRYKKS